MAAPGTAIQEYVASAFGRFAGDREPGDPPISPWTPMPAAGLERLRTHLAEHYDREVRSLTPLDCGVVRVDGRGAPRWIARVFPPARSAAATVGDVDVLRWLAGAGFPAERLAHDDPLTTVDGHAVLVTELAPGKPISSTRVTAEWQGDALGWLHATPLEGAPERAGGGWHHLSLDGGGRRRDRELLHELLADRAASAKEAASSIGDLREALDRLDLGEGLPEAMVHVDFGGPNILREKTTYTVIDWTGTGRASRAASLASIVSTQGNTAIDALAAAYRARVSLTSDELDRIERMIPTHQLVLAAWGVLFDPSRAAAIVAHLPAVERAAAAKASRVRAILTA